MPSKLTIGKVVYIFSDLVEGGSGVRAVETSVSKRIHRKSGNFQPGVISFKKSQNIVC